MVRGGVQRVGQQIRRLGASADSTQASKTKGVVAPSTVGDGPISSKILIERKVVFLPPCEAPKAATFRLLAHSRRAVSKRCTFRTHPRTPISRQRSSRPSSKLASYGIRVNGIRNLMPSGATNGS